MSREKLALSSWAWPFFWLGRQTRMPAKFLWALFLLCGSSWRSSRRTSCGRSRRPTGLMQMLSTYGVHVMRTLATYLDWLGALLAAGARRAWRGLRGFSGYFKSGPAPFFSAGPANRDAREILPEPPLSGGGFPGAPHAEGLDVHHAGGLDVHHAKGLDVLRAGGLDLLRAEGWDLLIPQVGTFVMPQDVAGLHATPLDDHHAGGLDVHLEQRAVYLVWIALILDVGKRTGRILGLGMLRVWTS